MGERYDVQVGPVAHGGHCVVRLDPPESRVVFVRHALPGERVVLEITEGTEGDRFWRGDAVEVVTASPDRLEAPCPVAGPGGCGGCDLQHVRLPAQRALKAAVVREQLVRLAGLDRPVVVEPVAEPAGDDGLRWRTRVRWATDGSGRRGFHAHRSTRVVPVDDCLIAAPGAVEPSAGSVVETVATRYGSHELAVAGSGFWQPHREAPRVLAETVLDVLVPRRGERVLDLFAGVGLFARFLADIVGPTGSVVAVEADRVACRHAEDNLASAPCAVSVVRGGVESVLAGGRIGGADLVVLDPPRQGARRAVVEHVVRRRPRAVAYVSCDPAALARDLRTFADLGYPLHDLRAFDLYPMTHHVECVALLTKTGSDLR